MRALARVTRSAGERWTGLAGEYGAGEFYDIIAKRVARASASA